MQHSKEMVNRERLPVYLDSLVDSVFKILPLFEEKNIGIEAYVESLIAEIDNLDSLFTLEKAENKEYVSLMLTIRSIGKEIKSEGRTKAVVKREVFKSIHIIKTLISYVEVKK